MTRLPVHLGECDLPRPPSSRPPPRSTLHPCPVRRPVSRRRRRRPGPVLDPSHLQLTETTPPPSRKSRPRPVGDEKGYSLVEEGRPLRTPVWTRRHPRPSRPGSGRRTDPGRKSSVRGPERPQGRRVQTTPLPPLVVTQKGTGSQGGPGTPRIMERPPKRPYRGPAPRGSPCPSSRTFLSSLRNLRGPRPDSPRVQSGDLCSPVYLSPPRVLYSLT